jgi:hypothetical protein
MEILSIACIVVCLVKAFSGRREAVELPAYADSYFEQLRAERDLDRFAAERWSL